MSTDTTRRRKRPVYIVVIPTGVMINDEEAELLVGIKQTAAGAERLQKCNPGAIVKKSFLVDD